MMDTTRGQRDELAREIWLADRLRACAPGGPSEQDHRAADRLLTKGYRKPRIITTVEELDALREGAVIRDAEHLVLELDSSAADRTVLAWHFGDDPVSAELPATVLWESEA